MEDTIKHFTQGNQDDDYNTSNKDDYDSCIKHFQD